MQRLGKVLRLTEAHRAECCDLEIDPVLNWKPVKLSEYVVGVRPPGDLHDDTGDGVLYVHAFDRICLLFNGERVQYATF